MGGWEAVRGRGRGSRVKRQEEEEEEGQHHTESTGRMCKRLRAGYPSPASPRPLPCPPLHVLMQACLVLLSQVLTTVLLRFAKKKKKTIPGSWEQFRGEVARSDVNSKPSLSRAHTHSLSQLHTRAHNIQECKPKINLKRKKKKKKKKKVTMAKAKQTLVMSGRPHSITDRQMRRPQPLLLPRRRNL